MGKEIEKRIKLFEIYVDESDDLYLAIKRINAILKEINRSEERLVLILTDELKRPELEETQQ